MRLSIYMPPGKLKDSLFFSLSSSPFREKIDGLQRQVYCILPPAPFASPNIAVGTGTTVQPVKLDTRYLFIVSQNKQIKEDAKKLSSSRDAHRVPNTINLCTYVFHCAVQNIFPLYPAMQVKSVGINIHVKSKNINLYKYIECNTEVAVVTKCACF